MNKAELVELASKLQVDVSGLNKAQIVKQLLGRPEELSELKDVALIDKVKMVSMQDQVNDKCEEVSRYRRESELLPNNYSFPGTGTPTSRDNAPEQKQDWGKACDCCGKLGHNVGNCFRKNGFPNRLIGSLGRSRFGNNTYRGFGRPGLGYHNTNLGHAVFRPNNNTLT